MKLFVCITGLLVFLVAGCKHDGLESEGVMRQGPIPGKPREEYRVTVVAKPEIQDRKDHSLLILPPVEGRPIEIVCGSFTPWYPLISKGAEMTFTLWQTKDVSWHYDNGMEKFQWSSKIEVIKEGGKVLYDARVCPIHKIQMSRGEIEISYGLPAPEFLKAFDGFSGGPGFVLGGCCVGPEKTEMGYRCDQCVTAFHDWEADFETKQKSKSTSAQPTDH